MLADVEDPDGTGRQGGRAGLAHLRQDRHRPGARTRRAQLVDHITWFISFAPLREAALRRRGHGRGRRLGRRAPARRSPGRFTPPFRSGTAAQPANRNRWPRQTESMFDADLNERQSRIDRLQLVALLGLMLLGAAFVYSATMVSESAGSAPWYNQSWFRQIVWYVLGIGAAAASVLRGLSHPGALVHGRLLGRGAAAGRWCCSSARCGSGRGGGSTWASSACSPRSLPSSRSSWPRPIS